MREIKKKGKVNRKYYPVILLLFAVFFLFQGKHADAAGNFVISKGVLTEYTGNSSRVTVPDNVKKLGASAFEGNKNITYVSLPGKVTEIGAQAFKDCKYLR